jgi:hypothetical protein
MLGGPKEPFFPVPLSFAAIHITNCNHAGKNQLFPLHVQFMNSVIKNRIAIHPQSHPQVNSPNCFGIVDNTVDNVDNSPEFTHKKYTGSNVYSNTSICSLPVFNLKRDAGTLAFRFLFPPSLPPGGECDKIPSSEAGFFPCFRQNSSPGGDFHALVHRRSPSPGRR